LAIDGREVSLFPTSDNEADVNPKLFAEMMCAAGRYDPHIRNAILHLRGAAVDQQYIPMKLTLIIGKLLVNTKS